MKYIKSSRGYYYKEYANGKRSRISLEEYNKKKKQFELQQRDGGGRFSFRRKKSEKTSSNSSKSRINVGNKNKNLNINNIPIIYLGDLFDSSCKGPNCTNKDVLDRFSFNIRNIKYIKDNIKNIHIFLGNRDINKLKLLELLKLNDENAWKNRIFKSNSFSGNFLLDATVNLIIYIDEQKNEGTPGRKENDIPERIVSETPESLSSNNNLKSLATARTTTTVTDDKNELNQRWKYSTKEEWDEGNFLPYWNINKEEVINNLFDHNTNTRGYKNIKSDGSHNDKIEDLISEMNRKTNNQTLKNKYNDNIKYYHWYGNFEIKTCNDMFDRIFGADPKLGTMSADLLKDSIYNEIIKMYDITNFSGINMEELRFNIDNNFKSALALVVFKLLMTTSNEIKNIIPKESNEFQQFVKDYSFADLLLHDNVHFCKAIEIDNRVLCFSHSGIGEKILTIEDFDNIGKRNENNANISINNQNNIAIEITDHKYPDKNIITGEQSTVESVNKLNNYLKLKLKELLNNNPINQQGINQEINLEIYRFLYISASFNNKSPIVAKNYNDLITSHENQITVDGKNIIQFTGHQPVGMAPVFNVSRKKKY